MNLKQNINGPAGVAIAVVLIGLFCFFLYSKFLKDPPPLTPEQTLENMKKGMAVQQKLQEQNRGMRGPQPGRPGGGTSGSRPSSGG